MFWTRTLLYACRPCVNLFITPSPSSEKEASPIPSQIHYEWDGRGVPAARSPTHPFPKNGKRREDRVMIRKYCHCSPGFRTPIPRALPSRSLLSLNWPSLLETKRSRRSCSQYQTANRADRHSALEHARGPMSPTHRSLARPAKAILRSLRGLACAGALEGLYLPASSAGNLDVYSGLG